jgi:excisionase family DNA binding protein
VAGLGAEVAVGASIAQQMLNQPGGAGGTNAGLPELVGPTEAAKALGVSESDVIASLESGDLKGKKIGTQWRITKAALRDFLG